VALNAYLTAVQNLLGTGSGGALYPTATLTTYINTARNQIAAEGQCVRVLPPINGPITSITVTNSGAGYTSTPTVTISAPDSLSGLANNPGGLQATASAVVAGTKVTSITLQNPGAGYFQPVVTITSGGGTGAVAVAVVSGINVTTLQQEVYPFSSVNPLVATSGSGVSSILSVNSISLIFATFRYTLIRLSFSRYQAYVRNYTAGYLDVPVVFTQFAQGGGGSVYLYPLPNQQYQMEWDTCCLPSPLLVDTDIEALPYPWTDAVPFLAAYYAFSGKQRFTDADRMWAEFEKFMKRARQMSNPRGTINHYGRG
jgi:hypothetical protein